MTGFARGAIALAAGLALADASIVTLGLPSILVELDTTVEGVALVLGVYTAVLAVALLPLRVASPAGAAPPGWAPWGLTLFGLASLACGLVDDLDHLARAPRSPGGRRRRRARRPPSTCSTAAARGRGGGCGWRPRCSARRSARRWAAP